MFCVLGVVLQTILDVYIYIYIAYSITTVVIAWQLDLQLPVQSVSITTTKIVSSNPVHGKVYSIQHYVINLVSDLRQVGGFRRVYRFLTPIKMTATIYWNIVESGVKHHKPKPYNDPSSYSNKQHMKPYNIPAIVCIILYINFCLCLGFCLTLNINLADWHFIFAIFTL